MESATRLVYVSYGAKLFDLEVEGTAGERLYGELANRMAEGEQGPRVATPGLVERDFD